MWTSKFLFQTWKVLILQQLLPVMVQIPAAGTGANVSKLKHPIADAVTSRDSRARLRGQITILMLLCVSYTERQWENNPFHASFCFIHTKQQHRP